MFIVKLVASIFVLCSGVGFGFYSSFKLSDEENIVAAGISMLEGISSQIRYSAAPCDEIIRHLAKDKSIADKLMFLTECSALLEHGVSYPRAIEESLKDDKHHDSFIMLSELGASDADHSLGVISIMSEKLKTELADTREKKNKYGKMYKTLGALGGAAVVIFIW
jgi:Stage III sporulation protein AB (spore_III_AB).